MYACVSSRGAKGWWRQEGQQCCQTPSISVSTFLRIFHRLISLSVVHALHTPPCFSSPPLPGPIANVSLPPSLRNPPSFLPPSIRFPRPSPPSRVTNRRNTYIHNSFFARCANFLLFIPFPLSFSLSFFLSFFFNKHAREKCRRSRGKISERIPLPLVREDESKEEKRNALLGDETA